MSQFLRRNPIDGVGFVMRPPGFLYDVALFTPPADDEIGGNGAAAGTPPEVQALIDKITTATAVPKLSPRVYTAFFKALVTDLAQNAYDFRGTNTRVRALLGREGIQLLPAVAGFILKGLEFQKHRFSNADTFEVLTGKFRRQAVFLARGAQLTLDETEMGSLEKWIGAEEVHATPVSDGGMTTPDAPEDAPATTVDGSGVAPPADAGPTPMPAREAPAEDDPMETLHRLLDRIP
jgi:hypothetical protein